MNFLHQESGQYAQQWQDQAALHARLLQSWFEFHGNLSKDLFDASINGPQKAPKSSTPEF